MHRCRIQYLADHLDYVCKAANEGVAMAGYLAWSFMDNFEWADGYMYKFGLVNVDFNSTTLTRTAKDSAKYMSKNFFKYGP